MLEEFMTCTSCKCYICTKNHSCPKVGYENPCIECSGIPPYAPWDTEDEKLLEITCDCMEGGIRPSKEMNYSRGPWKLKDSALVDPTGYEIVGIFPAHGDNKAWLTVGKEGNQLLLEAAPDMYEALKGLIDLLDADDPGEVGCRCSNSGDTPIICVWCAAQNAITKAEGN